MRRSVDRHDFGSVERYPIRLSDRADVFTWYMSSMVAGWVGGFDIPPGTAGALLALIVDSEGPTRYLEEWIPEGRVH